MSVLDFFTWCENSPVGEGIRNSLWLFPAIEAIHLLGLAAIGGAVLVVDLRLLGLGLRQRSVRQIYRDVQPWLLGSLAVMLISGVLMFISEATKCYYHAAFWFKMTSLGLAILFAFTVRRKAALSDGEGFGPLSGKAVAMISVVLWSGVGIGGRWIGFS